MEEKEQHPKRYMLEKKSSSYLDDQPHTVWKRESKRSLERVTLQERRNRLINRVWATQQVLREQSEGGLQRSQSTITSRKRRNRPTATEGSADSSAVPGAVDSPIHQMVSQYAAAMSRSELGHGYPMWAKGMAVASCDSCPQLSGQHFDGSPRPQLSLSEQEEDTCL